MEKIRILLVDDQKLFVENLRIVLESKTKDMEVVDIAFDGSQALELVRSRRPHIVLLDVRMPVLDGVETAKRMRASFPEVKIIMLTTFDDDVYVYQALEYGVSGYLLKNIPPEELFCSIRAVHGGSMLVSPDVMQKILQKPAAAPQPAARRSDAETERLMGTLTARELQILKLLYMAYDNRQISEKLHIAEHTVKNHIHVIYSKMGVTKRAQLMRLMAGLV